MPVYLGDLQTLKNGEKKLTWNNVDQNDSMLDPQTLRPLDLEEEELKQSTQMLNRSNASFSFLNLRNSYSTRNRGLPLSHMHEYDRTYQTHSMMGGNDTLVYDKQSLPWYIHGMDYFELAITGNAFLFLIHKIKSIKINNPDMPKIANN